MNQGQGVTIVVDGVLQSLANQTLGACLGNRLDTDTAHVGEADLLDAHFFGQELDDLFSFRAAGFPLDTRVDVFGVLAEDDHVNITRLLDRARHTFEPANRTLADIEVEFLTQGNVQGADTTAYRSSQRAFDGNNILFDGVQRFSRQPGVLIIDLSGFLARIDFHPGNLALAGVRFFNSSVDDLDHDRGNIETDAVTLDEGDDRVVGYVQGKVGVNGNFVAAGRHLDLLVSHL